MTKSEVHSGRLVGALVLLPLGILILALAIGGPFLMSEDRWLFLIFGDVPLILGAGISLVSAYGAWVSRIELTPEELILVAPRWRAMPVPPATHLRVRWDEVTAVRHRTETYFLAFLGASPAHVPQATPFPVPVYAIDTRQGRAVFGGRYGLNLRRAMRAVAERAGLPIQEQGAVPVRLMAAVLRGTPEWDR